MRRDLIDTGWRACGRVRLLEPLLQERLQLAHILEAQLQRFEPTDGGLREHIAIEGAQGQTHVGLGEAELDAPLLELLGERFEIIGGGRVLFAAGLHVRMLAGRIGGAVVLHVPQRMVQRRRAGLVVGQHAVHDHVRRAVVLEGRRGAVVGGQVVGGGDDGRVPGVRRGEAGLLVRRPVHIGRLDVEGGVVVVVVVVVRVVVHAGHRRPVLGVAGVLQADPRVVAGGRGQRDRVVVAVGRRRGRQLLVVGVVVVVLAAVGQVLHFRVGDGAGRGAGVVAEVGDVHDVEAAVQLAARVGGRHVGGGGGQRHRRGLPLNHHRHPHCTSRELHEGISNERTHKSRTISLTRRR